MTNENSSSRNVTIDSHLLKVVEDAYQVRREKGNLKFIKHEMLPPLTASFRQNRAIRQVDRVHSKLKKEIEKCDQNDVVRQQKLMEVEKKCENLKAAFQNAEGAISQLQKQKETHKQVMDNIVQEIKSKTMEIKRYFRAAEDLTSIRDIMQSVINENTCYLHFLEKVAAESKRYRSAREITGRYEKLLHVKKILNERLDESLEKVEATKQQVLLDNATSSTEQHFVLQKLQAIDYELNLVKSKTIKYEMALNNISIDSLAHMRTLNLVLKSAEQMIENLINSGIISKKYKKKTLSQQFEVIRKDYLKKKAVIREYQRGMETLRQKKSKRVKIFEDYENQLRLKLQGQRRLDDLSQKKKLIAWKKAEAENTRRLRRLRGTRTEGDSDEEFDYKQEPGAVLDLHLTPVTRESEDDWEDDDEEEDFDDLGKFGSHDSTQDGSELVDSEKPEFISTSQLNQVTSDIASASGSASYSTSQSHFEGIPSLLSLSMMRRFTPSK